MSPIPNCIPYLLYYLLMPQLRLRDVKGLAKDNNTAHKCTVLRVKLSLDWFQCQQVQ